MRKALILLLFSSSFMIAQKTCESKEEAFEDLNTITKCTIESSKSEDKKNTRQISVQISAPKTRYLKRRVQSKKEAVTSSVGNLNTSGVSNTNHTGIASSLELKENKAISNVALIKNTLSGKELKNAVRFHEATEIPVFKSCSSLKKQDRLDCFNKEMVHHIEKHFNYPHEAIINKTQGKVWVRFVIDKEGNISNIKTLGPKGGEILNNEAVKVVSKLPNFVPGTKNGKKVSVKYGFPISFSLDQ